MTEIQSKRQREQLSCLKRSERIAISSQPPAKSSPLEKGELEKDFDKRRVSEVVGYGAEAKSLLYNPLAKGKGTRSVKQIL
jgi:hypothetical protein